VPTKPNLIELSDLNTNEINYLMNYVIDLGKFIKNSENYDKVNIGMMGNVVSQLHLHLVLRRKDDPAWPCPVWGRKYSELIDQKTFKFRKKLITKLTNIYLEQKNETNF